MTLSFQGPVNLAFGRKSEGPTATIVCGRETGEQDPNVVLSIYNDIAECGDTSCALRIKFFTTKQIDAAISSLTKCKAFLEATMEERDENLHSRKDNRR